MFSWPDVHSSHQITHKSTQINYTHQVCHLDGVPVQADKVEIAWLAFPRAVDRGFALGQQRQLTRSRSARTQTPKFTSLPTVPSALPSLGPILEAVPSLTLTALTMSGRWARSLSASEATTARCISNAPRCSRTIGTTRSRFYSRGFSCWRLPLP